MNQLEKYNLMQRINGGKGLDTVTLEVKHDFFPINDIPINADSWCDIGGHKVPEEMLHNTMADASVCEDCWDNFN